MANKTIVRYTPQFYNDTTKKWVNVRFDKGPYRLKTWALEAIAVFGRPGCKHRLLVEKFEVTDVSYEEVEYGK